MESADPIDTRARDLLDGELLRAFAAFAETLNFTRAAARIGLSQPALFERVRRLSERLGHPVYTRDKRSITLTKQGRALAAYARETLTAASQFAHRIEGTEARETVTLAAGRGAFLYLLAAPLRRFEARHPGVFVPRVLGGPSAARAVACGEADLAIGVYDVVPDGLVAEELCRASMCVALPDRHRLARRKRVRLSDLSQERTIVAPPGQRHHALVTRALASQPDSDGAGTDRAWLTADGWPLMLSFVAAGLGVAIVNGTCRAPEGVLLRPVPELGTVTYRLLRRRAGCSASAEALRQTLTEEPLV